MATIQEALAQALQHHQSGNLAEAERIYRLILNAVPGEPDAWHRLGMVACQAGNPASGVEAIRRAIAIKPDDAAYHVNLGVAYDALGRTDEAVASFRQAVKVNRHWPDGFFALGVALARANQLAEAVATLTEAARLAPLRAEPQNELGIALARLGRMDEAAEALRQATRLRPDYAEAYNNLGNVRVAQGRIEEAIGRYRKAIDFKPNYYQPHAHLGVALARQGRIDESIECLERAIRIEPNSADAHNNLGNALLTAGRLEQSQHVFQAALKLNPNFAPAVSNYLLQLNYDPAIDSPRLADEHRTWAARFQPAAPDSAGHDNTPDPERNLRIGYISADFRRHPVGSFIMPVLTHGDRGRVTTILLADVHVPDAMTKRFQSLAGEWHNTTGMSTGQLAALVRQQRIDILVDLGGHTSGNRLAVFGRKPAPVQVSYIGYPTTTGLSTIDYQVTDAVVDHPGDEQFYSESLVRLPGGFSCYTPLDDAPEVNPLPAAGAGHVTFGALHNLAKLNSQVLALWARVIRQVPGSRLIVARDVLTGGIARLIGDQLMAGGLQSDQFELRHEFPGGHLALYREIDIALDAFPWSGHTTACEAMWMGVPTVSLVGNRHAGRMVASVFQQIGLENWLAADADAYVAIAQRAAGDLPSLAALRGSLRQRMAASPLCDAGRFVGELEDAYR
ncbi:MAG TPA: tetratricopeptide repeat protein, partial [Pirellulales bacterium]|nr:tetratricopeptide repeat protein [Pirellulales bacterium]